MMTQTVTVQSWTIQAVPNPANLQATGENIDTPAHSEKKKKKKTPADPAITIRHIAERQELKACVLHHEQEHKTNPW